jgi:MFS family permease
MGNIAADQKGIAAGLYSLIRFGGTLLGPALAGVVLQQGLDRFLQPITAYHIVFWLIAGVAVLGVVLGWKLQE